MMSLPSFNRGHFSERDAMPDDSTDRPNLVYLDQNVLLDMAYGHLQPLQERLFRQMGFRLVYSTENLEELRRVPIEHHGPVLAFLRETQAGCARMALDMKSVNVDFGIDPVVAFTEHCDAVAPFSELDYSLHGFTLKLFGGAHDESREEIALKQTEEISAILNHGLRQLDKLEVLPVTVRAALRQKLEAVKAHSAEVFMASAHQMDEVATIHGEKTAQEMFQIDSSVIKPPNVIPQVWAQVSDNFEPSGISLEQVFGLAPIPGVELPWGESSLVQKVNAIYGQLNLFGYYRDGGIKKIPGQKRSFTDSTHAGYALCAKLFVCRDRRLVKKAVAVYEHLGLQFPVVLEVKGNPRTAEANVTLQIAWPRPDTEESNSDPG